jgi:hypothetical protein
MTIRQLASGVARLVGILALVMAAGDLCAQIPVVHWNFNEAGGGTTNALDTGAAPATNGVLGTTATRTSDTPGGGPGFALDISAPGASSIVDGGNPIEVDTLAQFTFSSWVKVTGTTHYNEGGSANVRLLSKQSGGAFDGFTWNLTAPSTPPGTQDAFRTGLFVGGSSGFLFSFSTADILNRGGEWIFLATTYDGTSTTDNARFYIGDENTPVALLGSPVTIAAGQVNSTNTSNGGIADARFGIGFTDAAATADTALTGYQDDVRVYDSVLDLAALDAVRLASLPGDTGLDGDHNGDGIVDAADYVAWRKLDSDNPQGYTDFVSDFGESGDGGLGGNARGPSNVPEPATAYLLLLGLASIAGGRRTPAFAMRSER